MRPLPRPRRPRRPRPLVSEHVAFVAAGGLHAGHLTPVPRTRAMLRVLVDNVRAAQRHLSVPLALENISALFAWPEAELSEAEFVSELLRQTDALLLLDIANVYANARNLGLDPLAFLRDLPLDRIAYVHVGGGREEAGVYHDTHADSIDPNVLKLLEDLAAVTPLPAVMLERDDDYPDTPTLYAELDTIAAAAARGTARREAIGAS